MAADFGELVLEEIEVRLEAFSLYHFGVVVPLDLLAGGILGDECFGHLNEIVEWMGVIASRTLIGSEKCIIVIIFTITFSHLFI